MKYGSDEGDKKKKKICVYYTIVYIDDDMYIESSNYCELSTTMNV